MIVKVYIDVLLIINFIIDYILLSITSLFVRKKPCAVRIGFASGLGAVYASCIFFFSVGNTLLFFMSLAISLIMIWIAYGVKCISSYFKNIAAFYLVSFVASGVGFAILIMVNQKGNIVYTVNSGVFYADINAYTLLAVFIIATITIHMSFGYINKQRIKQKYLYIVTIEKNGKSITDTALFDTGNFLKDPILQNGIVIAEWQTVSSLFSKKSVKECVAENPEDFTYIPCHSINGNTGIFAFRPDKIFSDEIIVCDSALVGISETLLDKECSYRIILPNDSQLKV